MALDFELPLRALDHNAEEDARIKLECNLVGLLDIWGAEYSTARVKEFNQMALQGFFHVWFMLVYAKRHIVRADDIVVCPITTLTEAGYHHTFFVSPDLIEVVVIDKSDCHGKLRHFVTKFTLSERF